jgi:hypothetical protein
METIQRLGLQPITLMTGERYTLTLTLTLPLILRALILTLIQTLTFTLTHTLTLTSIYEVQEVRANQRLYMHYGENLNV